MVMNSDYCFKRLSNQACSEGGDDLLTPRPYQLKLIEDARQSLLNGKKAVCCVLGCGGG